MPNSRVRRPRTPRTVTITFVGGARGVPAPTAPGGPQGRCLCAPARASRLHSQPDGRRRGLAIPAVRDRVAAQAMRLRLEPHFEPRFAETSYGFRPGRSAHQAIGDVMASLQHGDEWIVEIDIERFFDTASHDRLLAAVAEVVADGRILRLVQAFLQAGVMEEGKKRTLVAGTPKGGVLSPLLSNAFLNTFEHQMLAAGRRAIEPQPPDRFDPLPQSISGSYCWPQAASRHAGSVEPWQPRSHPQVARFESDMPQGRGIQGLPHCIFHVCDAM
ncbi:MAG TPA: reverse transcriptase domain-containing protein [bacterium]|nr:reverse transcriptase domain-containing protein [bacterium]